MPERSEGMQPFFSNGHTLLFLSDVIDTKKQKGASMCSSPISHYGLEFACKQCNDCINRRKNEWVARCMAEKATSFDTFSITLTYNEETQHNRDAARSFVYSDVNALLKRLRRAAQYQLKISEAAIRFACAGEMGGENGRCHWHLILFASCDLLSLGDWTRFGRGPAKIKSREEKITRGKVKKRLNWSLWEHGFITVQEPDQWGMEYALTYALKDQFSLAKSEGTMRESRVTAFSAGCFRMSKFPPIGAVYLQNRVDRFSEAGQLPTSLDVPIPDYKGYWHPTGASRKWYIDELRLINEAWLARTGRDAPQWSSLIASCSEQDKERLIHGEEKEDEESEDDFLGRTKARQREIALRAASSEIRRNCGGFFPCFRCEAGLNRPEFAELTARLTAESKRLSKINGSATADENYRRLRRPSLGCLSRDEERVKSAFKPFA